MPLVDDRSICRCKVGLLFLRDCKEPAIDQCGRCGRPICGMHQVMLPQATYCPECAAAEQSAHPGKAPETPMEDDSPVDAVRRRQWYYGHYGYRPYYWGHHTYFSDHDHRVFDEQHVVHHEQPDEDRGGGADFDDAMES